MPYELEQLRGETKEFLADLTERDQRMIFAVVTLVHIADSMEQLDADTETLMSIGREHLCQFSILRYQQEDGLNTVLPYGLRRVKALRTLTTESAAVLMPFRVQEIQDPGGLSYGVNAISKNLLICDRKRLISPHAFYLGVSGSGKSVAMKSTIENVAMATDDDIMVMLTVLYDTAARVSELIDIRICDVRLDVPAVITLHGKGRKIRSVPLMKQTVDLLKVYFEENRIDPVRHSDLPLFWNTHRKKLTRSGVTYILRKYVEMAQGVSSDMPLNVSPHKLRHTKAMHLVQANVNPVYIKDFLGHADISTTEIYARADNEAKRSALEKATEHLRLPPVTNWEQDSELIDWLSSLG